MSDIPEGENSLPDVDSDSDSHSNTYESLLPTVSSRSGLLQPSDITSTAQAYLLTRGFPITRMDRQLSRTRHHPHRHSRRSSHSSNNVGELKQFYKNVKTCFFVLFMCNVLVVIILFLTHPKFGVVLSGSDDDFESDGQPNTFHLCVKNCGTLLAKIGPELSYDIKSHESPGSCCFRRIDQLLDLVDKYTKEFIKQEEDTRQVKTPRNINPTCHVQDAVIAHTSTSDTDCSSGTLAWVTRGIGITVQGVRLDRTGYLAVTTGGYYYIYSHLKFKGNTTYIHQIRNNNKKLYTETGETGSQDSYSILQGIVHLTNGSNLSVYVKPCADLVKTTNNQIGLYKLNA
ncbi:uncharacterized protein [Haliotis cracherodii]|uniref:uncharacterized protein n=1 Tax=Haliotis cracherodii TaxID=6455 RepID=UPI0039EC8DA6